MLLFVINQRKTMKDIDINKYFGIPISTIQDWKKSDPNRWRYKLYKHLKKQELKLKQ